MNEKINLIIITGLSGAGKTKAIGILEDLGYFCVDNLPLELIENFLNIVTKTEGKINKLGIVIDARSGASLKKLPKIVEKIRSYEQFIVKVIFLEASVDTLLRRFSETRRKHPIDTGRSLEENIENEKKLLSEIREKADFIINTTNFSLKDLKDKIVSIVSPGNPNVMKIIITTFGFKYGVPLQADIVIDVRFIPNPFYIKELSEKNGTTNEIKDYVLQFDETKEFLKKFESLMDFLIPNYIKEGKSYLNIAFGCTGGKHRSVALGEIVANYLEEEGYEVQIYHRDLSK